MSTGAPAVDNLVDSARFSWTGFPGTEPGDCADSVGRVEPVGILARPDALRATEVDGVVCFTGMPSNEWLVVRT
ncbi:hypothetical protein GCM10009754_65300 [Amycolatopsis minnesotensis]|uniref:Uncharacterized protein n=1 Tax=Amycolatopsis minnesotensis TaxID=337894 RepID=A0ABP5DJB5_9PSEU